MMLHRRRRRENQCQIYSNVVYTITKCGLKLSKLVQARYFGEQWNEYNY